jgi:hypothetical protein
MLHINSLPRLTGVLLAVATFTTITTAQTILPAAASASFPQCALSCTQLIQAQNSCIPPAEPVTDQATYNACFCQSGLLAQLRISPDGTCDAFCTVESDRQLLRSWYTSYCASGATSATASTTVPSTLSTVTSGVSTVIIIINPTSSSSSSITPTTTGSGTTIGSTTSSNGSWYIHPEPTMH